MVGWSLRWIPNFFFPQEFYKSAPEMFCPWGNVGAYLPRRSEALLTLTSMCGKGPLEFSGTLIGGMTQSRFCLLNPLAADPLWCFRENLMTLGWESQTLDSISVMPAWKQTRNSSHLQRHCLVTTSRCLTPASQTRSYNILPPRMVITDLFYVRTYRCMEKEVISPLIM